MAKKFAQGRFDIKNPEKYVGKKKPMYRSGWEWSFMQFCDNHPGIIQWASESIRIPYKNPFTGKHTIYVPDFFIVYEDKSGKKRGEVIEVKPKRETSLQEAGRSKVAQSRAALNMVKWETAKAWCKQNNLHFRIVTEDDIFHNPNKR